ncbi:unnamed protein product [Echinostoma caproni]|uniref:Cadherin_C domain-containing protein n=1 Tax=Echinostoma caproni TaxID=27848 RepID=A0A183AG14_9TREM|nr:unnamed protein product [Echinostoma caproni]
MIHSPNLRGSVLEEDVTDYEELPYHPCYAPSDDRTSMYDLLDDDTKHGCTAPIESPKESKPNSHSLFDPITPDNKKTQTRNTGSHTFPNMLYLQPRMLLKPDGSEETEQSDETKVFSEPWPKTNNVTNPDS